MVSFKIVDTTGDAHHHTTLHEALRDVWRYPGAHLERRKVAPPPGEYGWERCDWSGRRVEVTP